MAYTKNPGTVVLFLFLIISSCKDEVEKPLPNTNGHRVLISNEGNFGWGAGSLSSYNPSSKEVENELYKRINGEEPGNVFQSICKINKQYFLVMNNSQSIIDCDSQFTKTGTITGFNSPRYMHKISESKAYVTDLYADKIWIVSLEELKITGSIAVSGWCENGIVLD
jgi:hypothetical protein